MKRPITPAELHQHLAHFSGTEHYHRTHPGLLATDGATKYLAGQAGAYWLLDIIWSVLHKITDEFAVLELSVQENRRAAVVIHDGREPQTSYHEQDIDIPWTDFPFEHAKLYVQQNEHERVVMLPSEY